MWGNGRHLPCAPGAASLKPPAPQSYYSQLPGPSFVTFCTSLLHKFVQIRAGVLGLAFSVFVVAPLSLETSPFSLLFVAIDDAFPVSHTIHALPAFVWPAKISIVYDWHSLATLQTYRPCREEDVLPYSNPL